MDSFPPDEYLKVDEVARLLRVSIRTVYRRIQNGELPAKKFGGLYYIRRSDLEAQLAAPFPSPERERLLKCGHCLRVIKSAAEIVQPCAAPNCELPICSVCAAAGFTYCQAHQPSHAALLEEAERQFQAGKFPLFVRSSLARARERHFLDRLRLRLNRVSALVHPQSGEVLNISDWEALLESGDQRSQLLALLGKAFLDRETIESTPLNASLCYRLPPGRSQRGGMLVFTLQCLSRLPEHVRLGYDTHPLGLRDLLPVLDRLLATAEREGFFHFIVLAATTGWDSETRHWLQGENGMGGYLHPHALIYLYDLEKNELLFNPMAEKAAHYAPLFNPLSEAEEVYEVSELIRKKILLYESLTLSEAIHSLPYRPELIEQAFKKLTETEEFSLLSLEGGEVAMVRKPF